MLSFVNAKINIGLQITHRRPDGYHDLQTIFYPVGLYAGTHLNPVEFCDALEIVPAEENELIITGDAVDCPREKNLVWKAMEAFEKMSGVKFPVHAFLDKHLPSQAGMGGGSADAAFMLRMLNDMAGKVLDEAKLIEVAARLGADCPFFIKNRPVYATGIGERMEDVDIDLGGWWCAIAKPEFSVSTREAFAGVAPVDNRFDLRRLAEMEPEQWREVAVNDFERSIFPLCPDLSRIKETMYASGAAYSSLTGSGSVVYGLFRRHEDAMSALEGIDVALRTVLLL